MDNKRPSYFSKKKRLKRYTFYLDPESETAYIPTNEEDFNKFLDALWKFKRKRTQQEKEYYNLFKKFPWLLMRSVWTGGIFIYDFFYPKKRFRKRKLNNLFDIFLIDDLYEADKKTFINFMYELKAQLEKGNLVYTYMMQDFKVKWGEFRWYDNGSTKEANQIIDSYLNYYADLFKLEPY